jgi:hypothetical protein
MSSRAIIVFADGSKQMAHNTDDLMLRWHERKALRKDEILRQHERGVAVLDCSAVAGFAQARDWNDQLLKQKLALENQLAVIRGVLAKKEYYEQTVHLRGAVAEIEVQRHSLLEQYPEMSRAAVRAKYDARSARIEEKQLDGRIARMEKALRYYARGCTDNGEQARLALKGDDNGNR